MPPLTERFEMRLDETTLANIDKWREGQLDSPSRAEAIRRLVEIGLTEDSDKEVKISDGEKILFSMMQDLYKHLKITTKTSEIDPNFVSNAVGGGHYWALKWKMSGILHSHKDSLENLRFVSDVMELWDTLEFSYENLSKKDQENVEKEATPFGKNIRFRGFDGNDESELLGIARFLVDEMDRFERFKERGMNSHMPSVETYKRMLHVYSPIKRNLNGGSLGTNQIISILRAMTYPEREK